MNFSWQGTNKEYKKYKFLKKQGKVLVPPCGFAHIKLCRAQTALLNGAKKHGTLGNGSTVTIDTHHAEAVLKIRAQ